MENERMTPGAEDQQGHQDHRRPWDQHTRHRGWDARRAGRAAGMGVLTGLVSAIPLSRVPRAPFALVPGALSAVATTAGAVLINDRARRVAKVQGEPLPRAPLVKRIAAPVVAGAFGGGLTAGAFWLVSVADEWTVRGIARLGAKHPRVTYAVLSGALYAVLEYAESAPDYCTGASGGGSR